MRAIDECTCGHHRDDHCLTLIDATTPEEQETTCVECRCPRFIPHPQPDRTLFHTDVEIAVLAFLTTLGDVTKKGDTIEVTLPDGETWTMGTPAWSHSKAPAIRERL